MRRKTLPDTIKVGPYRYTVSIDAAEVREMHREHPTWNGMADYHTQRIVLDDSCGPDVMAENLLHEVKHVIDYAAGIGSAEKITAHENIYRTSAWLLLVLRENPDLVAFLTAETP